MKKFSLLVTTILTMLMFGVATLCQAATITGTITNSTGKTKRIFITAFSSNGGSDNGYGVSIDPTQTLTYTINGVAANSSYTVKAFMDTQDMGYPHANDPHAIVNTVTYETTGTADFTLTNPTYVPPISPGNMEVIAYPGSGGNMLLWNGAEDNTGLTIADYYIISTNNSSASDSGATLHTVKAGDRTMFFDAGGTAGTYYKVTAYVGATPDASTIWIQPTPRTGGATVSGSVALSGVTPTGPLAVVLVSYAGAIPQFYVAVVPSPTASNSYSFSNIPAGTYNFFTFVDMNNDGTFSAGDLSYQPNEYFTPTVTVPASGTVPGPADITITSQNAFRLVNTSHNKNSYGESMGVGFKVEGQLKRPVNVKVSGPGIADNTDVGLNQWGELKLWPWSLTSLPTIGNTYTFAIYYADGSSDTGLTASISTILNSFAIPVSPEGAIAYNATPTFSWTAPSSPPSPYTYNLWLNGNDGLYWGPDDFPSSQTSVLFNADGYASWTSLTPDVTYSWGLSVFDRYGNSAQYQAQFIPTNKPTITGFSPSSALGGEQITLQGINFSTSATNTVTFSGGVQTGAVASSPTSLTITVPSSGVMNGSITVSNAAGTSTPSSMSFNLVQAVAVTGIVTDAQGVAVSGALVELDGNPAVAVSTAANGSFILTGLPGSNIPFRLKISKAGYLPVYAPLSLGSSMDLSAFPYTLFSTADLPGLLPTYGIILATIRNMNDLTPVSGATATALPGGSVLYYNSTAKTFTGTTTDASGIIAIPNVDQSTLMTIQPAKTGWSFTSQNVQVPSSSVAELAIFGTPPAAPQITNITPLSATAGSTVTITGDYFNDSYATNTVTFNGLSATITGGNSTTLYVTVPAGATTGNICVTSAGGGPICYTTSAFIPLYPLTLNLTGTGSGAVNATAGTTLSCNSGLSCPSVDVAYNTEVTLHEQPNLGSDFSSWTGCTPQTDASYCKLTVTGNSSVSASFTLQQNLRKGTDPSYSYYGTLKSALTSAVSGDIILARMMLLPDLANDATFDSTGTTVTLRGGYTDSGFTTRTATDFTSVTNPLTIKNGTLVLDQIIVK